MAEPKTRKTDASVADFIDAIEDDRKREDCREVAAMMESATGDSGAMWGASIVGFGRSGDWFLTGFAPRKQALTLYIMDGFERRDELMTRLGKHTTGKACLYIRKLDDVDRAVLREIVEESVRYRRETGGGPC